MFPADKDAALAETFRVLKPGGMMVATTWDRVNFFPLIKGIMTHVAGEEPPPPPQNPMSLSADGLFLEMVEKAGFSSIEQTTSAYPFLFGDNEEFQFKVATLLIKAKIDEFGDEGWAKAKVAFDDIKGDYFEYGETVCGWARLSAVSPGYHPAPPPPQDDKGVAAIDGNTFRMTVAVKA